MASHLNQPHFQDPIKARVYLESLRWPHGPVCPHCGSVSKDHYKLDGEAHRDGLYKCKDCREQFTATVGTVFERSKIKLNVWLQAVYLICSSKKGMSAHQMHRILGVTYKTAWFMAHRIREAMKVGGGLLGSGGQPVEADETYWGNERAGKLAAKKYNRRLPPGIKNKMKVVSLVERGGNIRSFHVPNVTAKNVKQILDSHVSKNARLMTDESHVYKTPGQEFADHQTVNHSAKQYVRGDVHVNTLESHFNIFKRGLAGTFHHVSEQHLQRYCTEFDFRYNTRTAAGYTDEERTAIAIKGIGNKRLTYRRINGAA
jgi:transposase-like protein